MIRALKTYGLILTVLLGGVMPAQGAEPGVMATKAAKPPMSLPAPVSAPAERVSVAELFTSQVCVFCPEAEALFSDMIKQPTVIGLACHVSYFDTDKTSLSRAFCAARQNLYNAALYFGPNFTPQMIVNGSRSLIGYQKDMVEEGMAADLDHAPLRLRIDDIQNGAYQFKLPPLGYSARHNILIALIDKPHRLAAAQKGQMPSVHYNVVSAIIDAGEWDGSARTLDIKVDFRPENKGFIVLAQNSETLRIAAAGQYLMGAGP